MQKIKEKTDRQNNEGEMMKKHRSVQLNKNIHKLKNQTMNITLMTRIKNYEKRINSYVQTANRKTEKNY
jgi:hypothetical protein